MKVYILNYLNNFCDLVNLNTKNLRNQMKKFIHIWNIWKMLNIWELYKLQTTNNIRWVDREMANTFETIISKVNKLSSRYDESSQLCLVFCSFLERIWKSKIFKCGTSRHVAATWPRRPLDLPSPLLFIYLFIY